MPYGANIINSCVVARRSILKNARKLFFFDQKINYSEESTNRKDREVYNGGESKDAKLCLSYLAPSSHAREARARVNGCRQSHTRGS